MIWKLGANLGMPKPSGKMMHGGMTKLAGMTNLGGMAMTWKDSISTCGYAMF